MYLTSISIKNFKKFSDVTVLFPSDITVIKGPNEQGKSSLLAAIIAGLFYDPKKSNKDILALKSWNTDKMYELTLDLEHKGERIRLYKNFDTRELSLENVATQKKLTVFSAIADYLFEIGALRDRALFEHTACVQHDALSRMTEGKRDISEALRELLTASGEHINSDTVLKKISSVLSDIQRGMKSQAKNPGALRKTEEEIAKLSSDRAATLAALTDVAQKSEYLGEVTMKFRAASEEFEAKKRQHEKNIEYFKTTEELKRLHAQFDRADADFSDLRDLDGKKSIMQKDLADYEHIKDFRPEHWYADKTALGMAKEQLGRAEAEEKALKATHRSSRAHMKPSHFVLSLVLFAAGFAGFMDMRLFAIWVLFAGAFVYSFVLKRGLIIHTPKELKTDEGTLSRDIAALEKKMVQTLEDNHVKNESELMDKLKTYRSLRQELDKLEGREGGMLRSRQFTDLEKERSELSKRIAIEEAKVTDEQKTQPPAPEGQRALELEIERLSKSTEQLRREMDQVNTIVHYAHADRETLIILEEELDRKSAEKARFERKAKTLESLSSALEEAQKKTIEHSRATIEEYMRKYLLVLTDGRYDDVKVKEDLSFEVWSHEKKGMIVPEEHLSKGTVDQFYLIARFAVLDILNKGVKSLVLLDDPFAGFDLKRRDRAREMLRDMTDRFQIILFTHSADYDGWGKVVEL